jgi:hypothetical protein
MSTKFPENFGTELAGLTFDEVFKRQPKWIECVSQTWKDDCTGFFKEFHQFVMLRLMDPISRANHQERCRYYVKTLAKDDIPGYLIKYTKNGSGNAELSLG